MIGWFTVTAMAILELTVLVSLARFSPLRRRIDYVFGIAFGLVVSRLLASQFGDMSVYFPSTAFSSGLEGKDQIIVLSSLSSFLVPLIIGIVCLACVRRLGKLKTVTEPT